MTWNHEAEQFLAALSSDNPTPGGGAAAAMAGAMGCALLLMAIGTTLKRKSTPSVLREQLKEWQDKCSNWQEELSKLMQKDAQAYESYLTACRLPAQDSSKQAALEQALWIAATVPADIASRCCCVLREINTLKPLIAPIILSDVACAKHLLQSAVACSLENIRINLSGLTEPTRVEKLKQLLQSFEKEIKNESDPS